MRKTHFIFATLTATLLFVLLLSSSFIAISQPPEERPPEKIIIPVGEEGEIIVYNPSEEQVKTISEFAITRPDPSEADLYNFGYYLGKEGLDMSHTNIPALSKGYEEAPYPLLEEVERVEEPKPFRLPKPPELEFPTFEPIAPFEFEPTAPRPITPIVPTPITPIVPERRAVPVPIEEEEIGYFQKLQKDFEAMGISPTQLNYIVGSILVISIALILWLVSKSETITLIGIIMGLSISTLFGLIPKWVVFLIGIIVFILIAREFGLGK